MPSIGLTTRRDSYPVRSNRLCVEISYQLGFLGAWPSRPRSPSAVSTCPGLRQRRARSRRYPTYISGGSCRYDQARGPDSQQNRARPCRSLPPVPHAPWARSDRYKKVSPASLTMPPSMTQVPPFHSEVEGPNYNPRELWVFHNHTTCGYGYLVRRDGKAQSGKGLTPKGFVRNLCALCEGQSY